MAQSYKPGETVPKTGQVECTQNNGTQKHVTAGTTFPPCDNWGDHNGKHCTWQYI